MKWWITLCLVVISLCLILGEHGSHGVKKKTPKAGTETKQKAETKKKETKTKEAKPETNRKEKYPKQTNTKETDAKKKVKNIQTKTKPQTQVVQIENKKYKTNTEKVVKKIDEDSFVFIQGDEQDCPDPAHRRIIPELFFSSSKIPIGSRYRAHRTVPDTYAVIANSTIPDAGLGVIARAFIPKYTWLGEFEGEIVTVEEDEEDDMDIEYMWTISKDLYESFYVTAENGRTSNWLRYVNSARHISEQNADVLNCYGKVYFITIRDIAPGTEILMYCGDECAKELNIPVKIYRDLRANLDFMKKS